MKSQVFLILLIGLALSTNAGAADRNGDGLVTVLVPIAMTEDLVPGAHGSLWTGITSFFNGTHDVVDPWAGLFMIPPHGFSPGYHAFIAPTVAPDHGSLFLIAPENAGAVGFGSRVLEISKSSQPTGFEVPVVWESDFLDSAAMILRVPTGDLIRSMLRVYDPFRTSGTAVVVEFLNDAGVILGSETLYPGNDPIVADQSVGSFRFPGYASIPNITSAHPALNELEQDYFHIRLRPLEEGMVFWGFVTVTSNESQHVLVIAPHK